MEIGVQSLAILECYGWEAGFAMIAKAGLTAVDLSLNHYYEGGPVLRGEPDEFFRQSDDAILTFFQGCKDAAAKWGVRFSQAHAPCPFYCENEAGNAHMLHAVEKSLMVCDYLGCPYLVVHPGYLGYDGRLTREDEWHINVARYASLIPAMRKYHVGVCLENLFSVHNGKIYRHICAEAEEACRYIDALNDIAGEKLFSFCFDAGHALAMGQDMDKTLRTLGDRVTCLHLHDNDGRNDSHLFPYMGVMDWDGLCRSLSAIGYRGALSFETFNGLLRHDSELAPECLRLLAACGRRFASIIELGKEAEHI